MLIVSVIIPALNASQFVEPAIRSVLAQTLRDLEIIVIDDGSTDGTSDVVKGIAASEDRIKLIRNAEPGGVSAARNAGIAASSGKWIAILDADDCYAPDRLERMIYEAESRGLDALADNLELVDFDTKAELGQAFPDEWMLAPKGISLNYLLEKDTPGKHNFRPIGFIKPLMRREFLSIHNIGYDEGVWLAEDFLLYARLAIAGAQFGLMNSALYIYSVRQGSVSGRLDGYAEILRINTKVQSLWLDSVSGRNSADYEDLAPIFRERDFAVRYERFVVFSKKLGLSAGLKAAIQVPPAFLASRLVRALSRRLRRSP